MINLFRSVTPWLLAIMLGLTVFTGTLAQQYAREVKAAKARIERAEQRVEAYRNVMIWQRDQLTNLAKTMQDREDRLAAAASAINVHRDAAQQLEQTDDETADWADQRLPAATRRWLRDLTAPAAVPDATGAGLPDAAAAAAGTPPDP